MKCMLILSAMAACAAASVVVPGPVAVRAPSHDSAIIQSHRLGGNFAYSTHEAHAYAVQTPVIGQRTVPVGVSYHQGTPIVKTSTDYITHKIPQVGYTAPQVTVKQVAVPQVALPQIAVPQVALPQVAVPQVALKQVAVPQVALPHVATYGALPYPYASFVAAKPAEETVAEEA